MAKSKAAMRRGQTSQEEREQTPREKREAREADIRERWANGIPVDIQAQVDAEQAQIDAFMKAKIPERGWMQEDIGDQTFERETLSRMKKEMKEAIDDDALNDDNVYDIQYNDGKVIRANWEVAAGRKVKMTGIKAIINSNEETTAFAGKVKIYSQLHEDAKEYLSEIKKNGRSRWREPDKDYGSDWRVDFE